MALKGTATIELTNADGSKEIIKHDNMITNAVNDLCLSQRGEMAAILKMVDQNESYAQAMFGGLLLFGDTLNDDPDDYTLPSTNIIGYASQSAYAGLDLARGSFNQSEGGVQEDGSYKFVWDFATSQGNGTIKALALCPNVMGKIGASDTIVDSERSEFSFVKSPVEPFNLYGRMLSDSGTTDGISNWSFHIAAIIGDIAYAVDYYNLRDNGDADSKARNVKYNGGILKLYKFRLGTESISLADKVARARYIETIDIQIPESIRNFFYTYTNVYVLDCNYNQRDKKLIVFPSSYNANIPVNGTMPYFDIDLVNNMQITNYTFTNTTAGSIYQYNEAFVDGADIECSFRPYDDYILVVSGAEGDYRLYIVDRKDNSKVIKVTCKDGDLVLTNRYERFTSFFADKNTVVIGFKNKGTTYTRDAYIIDVKTGVAKKTNITGYGVLSSNANTDFGNKVIKIKTGDYLAYCVAINPFILTTKNNLDSPVAKTASQTMKITYTLSEVSEV